MPVRIDAARLHARMEAMAAIGATPAGGVARLAASPAEGEARDLLCGWLREAGLRVRIDRVGNIFGLLEVAGPDAPLVLAGSHLDSQPIGGRLDGAYGVIAALEAVQSIEAQARATGRPLARNLGVVSWTNEEGARFQPSTLGSAVFAGQCTPEFALARRDAGGISLERALAAIGHLGSDEPPGNVDCYLEIHIEQGTRLERAGCPIGVVEAHWGTVKYTVEITGRAAHTGPTPMAERRDALIPAARLILFCRDLADEAEEGLRTSVGRLDVHPNSTNVVPARVRLQAELRAREPAALDRACARFEAEAQALAGDGIRVTVTPTTRRPAGRFDSALCALAEEATAACGHRSLRLDTVAGHDAIPLAAVCRSVLLFVPSVGGISHAEAEYTAAADLNAGAEVLASALYDLATGPG